MQKILALESLRGIAAFIVVLSHFAYAYYPAMTQGIKHAVSHSHYEWVILQTPLNIMINGYFAVLCFFILSGFVLSYGYFAKSIDLVGAAVKRYFRLAPVVFASVLLSYLLLKLHLYHNDQVATLANSPWFAQFWGHDPGTLGAIWEGLVGSFAAVPNESALNPVLWTIYYELIGSAIVFAFLALIDNDKRRWFLYILTFIAFSNTFFLGFIIGVLLCDLYVNKSEYFTFLSKMRTGYKVLLLILAIYLGSYPAYLVTRADLGLIHQPLTLFADESLTKNILYAISSVLFIVLVLTSRRVKIVFENKLLVKLGSISYSLYATHLLVLGSVGAGIFLLVKPHLSYNLATLVTLALFIPVTLFVAFVFRRYVDEPSIALSRTIAASMGKGRKKAQAMRESAETIL